MWVSSTKRLVAWMEWKGKEGSLPFAFLEDFQSSPLPWEVISSPSRVPAHSAAILDRQSLSFLKQACTGLRPELQAFNIWLDPTALQGGWLVHSFTLESAGGHCNSICKSFIFHIVCVIWNLFLVNSVFFLIGHVQVFVFLNYMYLKHLNF